MIIKSQAVSIAAIAISVDVDSNSELKDFMKGTTTFDQFFGSTAFGEVITKIVNTSHRFPFGGKRVINYDAITINVDQPYSQNTLFAIGHQITTGLTDITVTNRKGKKSLVGNVPSLETGALIECPLTMIISCMCAKEQLRQTKDRNTLTAAQAAQWQSSMDEVDNELGRLKTEQSEIVLMGEQAIAIYNDDIYFHQPVMVNWLHFIEQVDFDLAPVAIRSSVSDYRDRTIDIFKGVSGTAGTLDEIEAVLDSYGVGSHLTNSPWLRLPNKKSFSFDLSADVKSFLLTNGKYALGLFNNYLQSAYSGMVFDAKNMSGVMYDLCIKLTRLGYPNEFDTDSQDSGVENVCARAFETQLTALGDDKFNVLDEFETLLDIRTRKLNFTVDFPSSMTRPDLVFYKRALSSIRRTRAKWTVEISNAIVRKTDGDDDRLEMTLPSGGITIIRMAESTHFDFNRAQALKALDSPTNAIVDDMMDFLEIIESLFLYLMSSDVKKSDIIANDDDSTIQVGGTYRMLGDSVHHAIASPNPTILVPVG